uniref:G-protein coupled receptors family 1 profile domain-containing protein n=1 Tax=Suricata suricatta TaxID=37032 RepID=A0A673UL55_SURSU
MPAFLSVYLERGELSSAVESPEQLGPGASGTGLGSAPKPGSLPPSERWTCRDFVTGEGDGHVQSGASGSWAFPLPVPASQTPGALASQLLWRAKCEARGSRGWELAVGWCWLWVELPVERRRVGLPGRKGPHGAGAGAGSLHRLARPVAWLRQWTRRQGSWAMATTMSGATPCPANFSAAADRILSRFQEDFLWPVLVAEFLVATVSNSFALCRFCKREQRPWHPAVVFSAQLAVSDLLYALTLLPLAAYLYPPKNWQYGELLCRLERFLFTCNLLGSVLFIACISLNRYLGIVHPFFTRSSLRARHAWAVSAAVWLLAALLAAPTLHFAQLKGPQQEGNCSVTRPGACTKCLGTSDQQLEAYGVYGLVLAVGGCGLPLLLTLAAYGALGWAVLRSHGMTAAEKLRVAVLVASGLALYASSYVPYSVTLVLNVYARQRWRARCPGFVNLAEAEAALDQRTYVSHQVMRGLMPVAICIHPLLYMAVAPSCGLGPGSCLGCRESQAPEDPGTSGQVLPLNGSATSGP